MLAGIILRERGWAITPEWCFHSLKWRVTKSSLERDWPQHLSGAGEGEKQQPAASMSSGIRGRNVPRFFGRANQIFRNRWALSSHWNALQYPHFKNEMWKLLVTQNKGKAKLNAASDLISLNKEPTFNQLTGSDPWVNMLTLFLEMSCSEPTNGFVWRQISQKASLFVFFLFFFPSYFSWTHFFLITVRLEVSEMLMPHLQVSLWWSSTDRLMFAWDR